MTKHIDSPVNVIAAAVAKTFGGTHVAMTHDLAGNGEYYESWARVEVPAFGETLGYALTFDMRGYGVNKDKMTVRLAPLKIDHGTPCNMPSAGMDSKRDIEAICAAISKRVVNVPEAQSALQAYELAVAAKVARLCVVANHVKTLEAAGLTTSKNYPINDYEARMYGKVDLRVNNSGSCYIEWLSLSVEETLALIEIINKREK